MLKILVVDDEERIVDIIEKFLSLQGFSVIRAVGGEEALKILDIDTKIDLMILDMKMPKINGMDVIKKIKASDKNFPILILTGSIDAEKYLVELKQFGFDERNILHKPIDFSELLERIKEKLKI
ncbi:MAG: response regulator [Candidatus Omnitrophica bacterium]|nr:response regulator [Candidatus Omnitrophota bacterium]